MTITVTSHPETSPPSNSILLSLPAGSVTSSVSLWRDDPNGRTYLDVTPGFDSRTVTDYFAPYGVTSTYGWTATYFDPTAGSDIFNETWPNVLGWPNSHSGTWTATAGHAVNSSTGSFLQMARSVTAGNYRVTVDSLAASGSAVGFIRFREFFDGVHVSRYVLVRVTGSTLVLQATGQPQLVSTIDPAQPFTLDFFDDGTVYVSGAGGNETLSLAGMNIADIFIQAQTVSSPAQVAVGPIRLQNYVPPLTATEHAAPVALDTVDAWLIHPAQIDLSMPLAETDASAAGIVDIDPIQNLSNATVHKILGSATPIPTTTGPRGDDRTALTLVTVTEQEAAQLNALASADIALMVQIPPSWDLDFNNGYYLLGDVELARTPEPLSSRRTVRVPLQKVQRQPVDVVNTGWSYAGLAGELESYLAVRATYATYADLASNSR